MADDVAFMMEQLHLRTADVFGMSQGGMIAQYLAINYSHLMRKLVLGVTASGQNGVMEKVICDWIKMAEQCNYGTLVMDMLKKCIRKPIRRSIDGYSRFFPK